MDVKRWVRSNRRANSARRWVRFAQNVRPRDLADGRARAAFRVRPNSLLSYSRLVALWDHAKAAPPGAFVECGVYAGGSAGMVALASDRDLWLFDSWEGLPAPGPEDIAVSGHRREAGWNFATRDQVEQLLFAKLGVDPARAHLEQGWFDETIAPARAAIGPIGLLHLDGDWHDSIRTCLELLYDQVVTGGIVVVDDYFHWQGATKAADEFLAGTGIVPARVDVAGWWKKP